MKVYKIRTNNEEYPYLKEGCSPSKRGKTWSKLGFLKNALKYYLSQQEYWKYINDDETPTDIPSDWIIEEYELIKTNEFSAKEVMKNK